MSPERVRLPKRRRGFTQSARVGGHRVHLTVNTYPDGRIGEVFLEMHKEGAPMRGVCNALAILISLALQHGIPVETIAKALLGVSFEPAGEVKGHEAIKSATSIVDYVAQALTHAAEGAQ